MNTINQIKNFFSKNKFKFSLGSLVLLLLIILYLSSRVVRPTPYTTTVPITPSLTPTPTFQYSTLPDNYSFNFTDNTHIAISDSSQVFAVNKSGRLSIFLGDQSFPISPEDTQTLNYVARGNSVVYETGIQSDPENSFYIFNLLDKSNTKLDLAELSPVVAYYLSPDEKNLAIIGKFDVHQNAGNLYIYNIDTQTSNEISENVSAHDVNWIDAANILTTKEIDRTVGSTFFFSIYSLVENQFVITDLPVVKKSLTINYDKKEIYFINSENNRLTTLSLDGYKFNVLTAQKTPEVEILYNNKNNSLILLNTATPGIISLQTIDKTTGNVIKNNQIDLEKDTVYVEKFISQGRYFFKIYDPKSKSYTVKTLPL